MECREAIEFLLSRDNHEELPEEVSRHVESCTRCSAEFARMDAALTILHEETYNDVNPVFTERIMHAVREEAGVEAPAPLRNWLIAGTILIGGLFGLRFSEVMAWLRQAFGPAIDVAMSLILGIFLTAYICMLVGSNLHRVQRVFRVRWRE